MAASDMIETANDHMDILAVSQCTYSVRHKQPDQSQ